MEEPESILASLQRVSSEKFGDTGDFLDHFRSFVVDMNLRVLSSTLDERIIGVLYLIKKLTNDVWTNLFTDASFDAPVESKTLRVFSEDMARFVNLSIQGDPESDAKALQMLFKAIMSYYQCLSELVAEAEQLQVDKEV